MSAGFPDHGLLSDWHGAQRLVDTRAELERFGELEHLMQLVKARARRLCV